MLVSRTGDTLSAVGELRKVVSDLTAFAERAGSKALDDEMARLTQAANSVGLAWSGSSLGYHANVYTDDLLPPGRDRRFSVEWGLMDAYYSNPTRGYSRHDPEEVRSEILRRAKNPNIDAARKFVGAIRAKIDSAIATVNSIVTVTDGGKPDEFVVGKLDELRLAQVRSEDEILHDIVPTGQVISRDTEALGNGRYSGAHHKLLATARAYDSAKSCLAFAAELVGTLADHYARKVNDTASPSIPPPDKEAVTMSNGTHVFIGHGGSRVWKDLRDFVGRLDLPFDEFNRVPVAGRSNKERLEEMLDQAAIAFLVMTGEDETAAGKVQARQNVVHEAGLFQGRLGFRRAIIVLEEGCERFSNIDGLTDIRFPKGKIEVAFEEVRRVLVREGLLVAAKYMDYVSWECCRCHTEEYPMTHASGCGGDMVWQGADVKCVRCAGVFPTNQAFWCGVCGIRHDDFKIGRRLR